MDIISFAITFTEKARCYIYLLKSWFIFNNLQVANLRYISIHSDGDYSLHLSPLFFFFFSSCSICLIIPPKTFENKIQTIHFSSGNIWFSFASYRLQKAYFNLCEMTAVLNIQFLIGSCLLELLKNGFPITAQHVPEHSQPVINPLKQSQ